MPVPVTTEHETEVVVSAVETVADDIVRLTLSTTDGSGLPRWTPGAHIDIVLDDEIVRQYSLCSSPTATSDYQIAVLRTADSRGGSKAVHELRVGDTVRIRGPRNHFALAPSPRYIFVAGGIGITPILPMIAEADASGSTWELHYGGRTASSMAFSDLLAEHGDRVHLVPQDRHGLLDLAAILGTPQPGTLVYCCGPEPLLAAVEQACTSWPARSLHLERFTPQDDAHHADDTAFEVVLDKTGTTIHVEAGETVFDAMRAAGVNVLGSCLEGICGTCEQGVLEGEVDHRDSVLDDDEKAENDCMMVCVSRALGPRLVLDA